MSEKMGRWRVFFMQYLIICTTMLLGLFMLLSCLDPFLHGFGFFFN